MKIDKENPPGPEEDYFIMCLYKGKPRRCHIEVCKWHRFENDPECKDCKSYLFREKEEPEDVARNISIL